MLKINPFLLNSFTRNAQPIRRKEFSTADFKPVYNKNLNKDVVSFGNSENLSAYEIRQILENAPNTSKYKRFSETEIKEVTQNVSDKNRPFLNDLLILGGGKITPSDLIKLLKHINDSSVDTEKFAQKIEAYKNIPNMIAESGIKSPLENYLDQIPSRGITEILISDALLNNKDKGFKSFIDTYAYAARRLSRLEAKAKKDGENFNLEKKAKEIMESFFSCWVVFGMIFDTKVLNELTHNRQTYLKTVYLPRFKELNEDDLKLLNDVQTDSVTEKENKNDDITTYPTSMDDIVKMMNILWANRRLINEGCESLDFDKYITPSENENLRINFYRMQLKLLENTLKHIGIAPEKVDEFIQQHKEEKDMINNRDKYWDANYAHLFNAPKNSLLRKIIVSATNGDFYDMIYRTGQIASDNQKTARDFWREGINYGEWINTTVEPISLEFTERPHGELPRKVKTFTVKNWRRIPQESLFDGNYTTCCTGVDKNHGDSFLKFLTNTFSTTLEVRTEKNKVIGMTRLFFAKIGENMWDDETKLALIVENIEVNNRVAKNYLYDDKTKYAYREMIFDYVREFAKKLGGQYKDIPIYFSSQYYKVDGIQKGLTPSKIYEKVELVGEFPDEIYINSYGGKFIKSDIVNQEDGVGLRLHLHDITKKLPLSLSDSKIDGLDNYNYGDIANYNH